VTRYSDEDKKQLLDASVAFFNKYGKYYYERSVRNPEVRRCMNALKDGDSDLFMETAEYISRAYYG